MILVLAERTIYLSWKFNFKKFRLQGFSFRKSPYQSNISLLLSYYVLPMFADCTLYVLSQFCSMAFEKGCGGEKKSNHQRCSVRKGVLRYFVKFTEKNLCQSLFLNKFAGFFKK